MHRILVVIFIINMFHPNGRGTYATYSKIDTNPHLLHFESEGSQEHSFKKSSPHTLKRSLHYVWYKVKVAVHLLHQRKRTSIANIMSHVFMKINRLHSACIIGEEIVPVIHPGTSELQRSVHFTL